MSVNKGFLLVINFRLITNSPKFMNQRSAIAVWFCCLIDWELSLESPFF